MLAYARSRSSSIDNSVDGMIRPLMESYIDRICENSPNFSELKISFVDGYNASEYPLKEWEVNALIVALETNTHLQSVHLIGCLRAKNQATRRNSTFDDPTSPVTDRDYQLEHSLRQIIHKLLDHRTKCCISATEIGLPYNDINDHHASFLAKRLKHNDRIQILHLNGNLIETAGARALSDAFRTNTTLVELNLENNKLGPKGCRTVAHAIGDGGIPNLQKLNLARNRIGDEGVRSLSKVLANKDENHRTDSGIALQELSLMGNAIHDEGCDYISNALRYNACLLRLDLSNNRITDIGVTYMMETLLLHNYALEDVYLHGNLNINRNQQAGVLLLCDKNYRIKSSYEQVLDGIDRVPLSLWSHVIKYFNDKPTLVYLLLKTEPNLFFEVDESQRQVTNRLRRFRLSLSRNKQQQPQSGQQREQCTIL